jgi:hypothetical protein
MKRRCIIIAPLLLFLVFLTPTAMAAGIDGNWKLVPERSSQIELYATVALNVKVSGDTITLMQTWGGSRAFRDTMILPIDDRSHDAVVWDRVWPTNVFMGVRLEPGSTRELSARWEKKGEILAVTETYPLLVSQGERSLTTVHRFALSEGGTILTWTQKRPTRPENSTPTYTFTRADLRQAYMMKMADSWSIDGKLPVQAMLISLQGLANTGGPRLYFVYPEKWDFLFTPSVMEFYKNKHRYTFTELTTPESALRIFRQYVQGYVVWDKNVRTSLVVAFTIAGLEKAIVVSEDLIPMAEAIGLRPVMDLRGTFTGQNDAQIYQWAYDRYWDRCNREFVVWMGGEAGKIMKPGVADFGILKQAFFTDLSTQPKDSAEYALATRIMAGQKPMSLVMGWHSYAKDKERDHVTLASRHTLRVEGLHTLPNMSFSSHTTVSPGFAFRNNHHVKPGVTYTPQKKVYITCVQTDCLGLGAWLKPGRGEIPYAWEVTMNWLWLAPTMLEYFYGMATPNDYFIGSLGGPGYMYPKAVPPAALPAAVKKAYDLMKQLDLNVFEIMDYSEGATVEGNSDVTPAVMDAFYKGMPDAIGFINGYAPSHSFTVRDGRPLLSFDYYLSEVRPEVDAVADLKELAALNPARPYFLLVHVREWSDITRVMGILNKLGPEFDVVPLDVFLKMAGKTPTFKEHLLVR